MMGFVSLQEEEKRPLEHFPPWKNTEKLAVWKSGSSFLGTEAANTLISDLPASCEK